MIASSFGVSMAQATPLGAASVGVVEAANFGGPAGEETDEEGTVAIDGMAFLNPVRVGDTVACYAWLEKIGRTSMKICVDVWVTRYRTGDSLKVTSGVFTYVALAPDGKPTPVRRE